MVDEESSTVSGWREEESLRRGEVKIKNELARCKPIQSKAGDLEPTIYVTGTWNMECGRKEFEM